MTTPSGKKEKGSSEIRAVKRSSRPEQGPDRTEIIKDTGRQRTNLKYYLAVIVSLLTFAAYLPSLRNEFVHWDDNLNVYDNPFIRAFDMTFLKRAFLDLSAVDYWRPFTWVSHALDYAVWGLDPMGHHLTNNILHAINAFIVVLLVIRLLGTVNSASQHNSPRPPISLKGGAEGVGVISYKSMLIAAVTTGLLFGLNPVQVESVAWVSERKNLLYALFFLLSIMMYIQYVSAPSPDHGKRGRQSRRSYILSLIFFIFALMSKPMAVTLPVVLFILDWYPFRRLQSLGSFRSIFIEKVPFIALSFIASVMTVLAQKTVGATEAIGSIPFSTRILVVAKSLVLYLWMMIFPANLVPYYSYPKDVSLLSPEYFIPILFIAAITAGCLLVVRKHRLFLACWLYYVITLLPVIGIIQTGHQSMADRYLYLPGLGLFLIIGILISSFSGGNHGIKDRSIMFRSLGVVVAVAAISFMAYKTISQIRVWRDSISLWTFVIEKEPSCDFAYVNRGSAYNDSGQFDKAIENFNAAMAINPSYFMAYYNRGITYTNKGALDLALPDLNKAISLEPAAAAAYYARGIVFQKQGQSGLAIADFEKAVAVNPSYESAYFHLGVLYGKAGLIDKAITNLDKAIDLRPDNFFAYIDRGFAYSLSGQFDKALKDLDKAIDLDSGYAGAYGDRGSVYLKIGKKELAFSDFKKACSLGDREACNVMMSFGP